MACWEGILINSIIMGWVILAMVKLMGVLFDLDAIVLRREARGGSIRWGLQIHEIAAHVLSRVAAFVCQKLEGETLSPSLQHIALVNRHIHGETAQIMTLYDQAVSDFES